jgi:transcriptional regulator with XRE-family HTH domain
MKKESHVPPYCWSNREHESRINEFRLANGLTVGELARLAEMSVNSLSALNNGTKAPIVLQRRYKNSPIGDWKPNVKRLAAVLGTEPAVLFPRYACQPEKLLLDEQIVAFSMGCPNNRSAEEEFEIRDNFQKLLSLIDKLFSPREKHVLSGVLVGKTQVELAQELCVSSERIGQILAKVHEQLIRAWKSRELIAESRLAWLNLQ